MLTIQLSLQLVGHVGKLDVLERFEHVCGGDAFVLLRQGDIVCTGKGELRVNHAWLIGIRTYVAAA